MVLAQVKAYWPCADLRPAFLSYVVVIRFRSVGFDGRECIVNFVKKLRLIYNSMRRFLWFFIIYKVILEQFYAKNVIFSAKCLFSLNFFCTFAF